ncbi:molybdate ABC transporter substrate-binding protein [Nautilia sp.]
MRVLIFALVCFMHLFGDVYVGIPGGYKDVFVKLISDYDSSHKIKVNAVYAPLGMLMAQAKLHTLNMIIGDKETLNKNGFKNFMLLGYGKLVVLTKTKLKSLKDINKLKRLALPNPETTIYGKAAREAFDNLNLHPGVFTVSMMPQGINYLIMNQCDSAVASKTASILLKGRFFALDIPQKYYKPVLFGISVLKKDEGTESFIGYLKSKKVRNYLKGYGI